MCALAWMHVAACTSFSTSRSDVTSTEIRIRKLEYNLSKLLAHRDKIATETGEKLEAKRKQEQEDAAFFKSIADTNDGLIKIEAARAARSVPTAVRGCERIARIARFELPHAGFACCIAACKAKRTLRVPPLHVHCSESQVSSAARPLRLALYCVPCFLMARNCGRKDSA